MEGYRHWNCSHCTLIVCGTFAHSWTPCFPLFHSNTYSGRCHTAGVYSLPQAICLHNSTSCIIFLLFLLFFMNTSSLGHKLFNTFDLKIFTRQTLQNTFLSPQDDFRMISLINKFKQKTFKFHFSVLIHDQNFMTQV